MGSSDYRAPLDGVPRYTSWEKVPGDWYTRTQLARMDPPRKPAPGAEPRGQALYHGNCYAPLYALEATALKRATSPLQRAALVRARELQYVCRLCGGRDRDDGWDQLLGKGRVCSRCRKVQGAYRAHQEAASCAAALYEMLVAGRAVVLAVSGAARPSRLVAAGRRFHCDAWLALPGWEPEPGALPPAEAFARLAERIESRTGTVSGEFTVICWDRADRGRLQRLLVPELAADLDSVELGPRMDAWEEAGRRAKPFPWLANGRWEDLAATYATWYAEPARGELDPLRFEPSWKVNPLGDGDIGDRAASLELALEAMATDRPDAVSPRAPWITHPAALTDPADPAR